MPRLSDNMLAGLVLSLSFIFAGCCVLMNVELKEALPLAATGLATGAAIARTDSEW